MSTMLEHIKNEVKSLRPAERFDLWRDLGKEFDPPLAEGEDEKAIEAEWDAEIDARVNEIEEGKVELISGEESERRIDALFAKHGIQRRSA